MELPAIPPPEAFRFRCRRRTRWCDEDKQKVLNNAVYLSLLEEGRYQYFQELGLLKDDEFPFVLMQTNIRYLAPGRGSVEVEIALRTTSVGRSSFVQAYRVTEVETERLLVEAEAVLVAWDGEGRCKGVMGESFREGVVGFEGL
jgi:acyl-CoA thioester hydrolase